MNEFEVRSKLRRIFDRQELFQELVGYNLKQLGLEAKLNVSEAYILKMIEECVELRKTMPSAFNQFEKNRACLSQMRMLQELSDVLLFAVNFMITWDVDPVELLLVMEGVQDNNFDKLQAKLKKEEA